ncbi:MAG TPA: hypothetical protein VKA60_24960 [Blastocatellia bacterium]|nr:hypothetical protein [Blastocatellia bacterium]
MTTAAAQEYSPAPRKTYPAIFWAGLIAGTLDITAACITSTLRGGSPLRVLRYVAGGLLGPEAFAGGFGIAALGLLLHYCIATTWAAIYYAASRKLDLLVRRAVVCGLLYGIVVWCVMNLVVLPLSALPKASFTVSGVLIGATILMFCIGLPIALIVRRYCDQSVG